MQSDQTTPGQELALRLIEAWAVAHGRPAPWAVAVQIVATTAGLNPFEKQKLLALGDAPPLA